jgi:hypothetical protein
MIDQYNVIRGGASMSGKGSWTVRYAVGQEIEVGLDHDVGLAWSLGTVVEIAVSAVYVAVPDGGYGTPQEDAEATPLAVLDPTRLRDPGPDLA